MSCLPKPVLRGHIRRRGLKGVIGALTFASVNSALYHFFVAVPRQNAEKEFLKNYDPDAHFKNLVKYGYYSRDKIKKAFQGY